MNSRRHFTGEYRAWFCKTGTQSVHSHTFEGLWPESLEVRNLKALDVRFPEEEKAGDYLSYPIIHARRKSLAGRLLSSRTTDVVILAADDLAFSEDLEDVVLSQHSGERRQEGGPVRYARFKRISPDLIFLSGRISFSVSDETVTPVPVPENEKVPVPEPAGRPQAGIPHIPDLVSGQPFEFPASAPRMAGGCLSSLFGLLKWFFYLLLFLAFLGWLGNMLRSSSEPEQRDDARIETDPPKLNPAQDTLAPMPWDYLTGHRIRWNDFFPREYFASYSTSSKQFEDSRSMHPAFANPMVSDEMQYWNAVYSEFSGRDLPKLDSLCGYFAKEQQQKNLNSVQTAEMVITFIQEIPYCLVHEGSCREADLQAVFIREYHQSGKPCLPEIIAGVQSPYEFLHNLKGDCDTRSLLGFSILSRLGIPASIWVSQAYGHSVLGVGLGSGSAYYKMAGGIRHAAVELTAKGFRLGMISPEQGDMNNWKIALYKN